MRFLVVLLMFLSSISHAAPLADFTFKSPSFTGNGYGTYVLTIQNEEYTRKQAIQAALEAARAQAKADLASQPINQFLVNLESRIYAQISQNLATAMFSPGASTSGSMDFQGNTIFWQNTGGAINLQITDALGNATNVSVPLGTFTFTH